MKLKTVLKIAESHNLKIKWEKCQILCKRVNFLGYIIEDSTIKPSTEKTSAIVKFPIPRDRKSLERFLGITSYFRRFVCNYALIATPLTDLLKKDVAFRMGEPEFLAFEQLKSKLVNFPVLNLFRPKAITALTKRFG